MPRSAKGRVSRKHRLGTTMRNRKALRGRQSGAGLKPPQAAVVKSDGGEHCGKAGTRFRQAWLREASVSEPLQKCRKEIRRCQNRGLTHLPGLAWGMSVCSTNGRASLAIFGRED